MNPSLYLGILAFSSILSLAISFECYLYRALGSAKKLFYLMLSISAWSFFMYLTIVVSDVALKSILHDCLFIAIILTPLNFFNFIYTYTAQHEKGLLAELVHLLFIIPVINITLLVTNPLHHLFFSRFTLKPFGTHMQIFAEFNVFFWVHTAFAYVLTLVSIGLLAYEFIANRRYFKQQILLVILGAISPIVTNVVFLIDSAIAIYDFTPISLFISGLFFGYAINRYQIFNANPISRKLTLHSILDGVLILDDEGMIVEYNDSFEKQFHLDRDFRYASIQTFPLILKRILSISSSDETYNQQVRVADEESQIYYYKVKKIPISEKGSLFYIYMLTDTNHTSLLLKEVEQKQSNLQAIRYNKLRYLSSISHELRAPLNTLKSVAELLGEKKLWTSSEQQHLSLLAKNLHHKTNLILDYAKIEANEMKAPIIDIPLNQVKDVMSPYSITFEERGAMPQFIVANSTALALIEHISSALELIKVSKEQPPLFLLSASGLLISVVFDSKKSAVVFDALTSAKATDSLLIEEQLHWSLIKSLIGLSNAQISLDTVSAVESRLVFQIPLTLGHNPESTSEAKETPYLLLIDDSLITFFICQKYCDQQNIHLEYAENLAHAQLLLKKGISYKWILLDLHLENASGFDVVHQLKNKQTANTIFVAISSDHVVLDPDHTSSHGFDHFIQKPIKLVDFTNLYNVTKSKY